MSDTKVIKFPTQEDPTPHFDCACMCLGCNFRWLGMVPITAPLFKLQCPQCLIQDSFAVPLPMDYVQSLMELEDNDD